MLLYWDSCDGWHALDFHRKCDNHNHFGHVGKHLWWLHSNHVGRSSAQKGGISEGGQTRSFLSEFYFHFKKPIECSSQEICIDPQLPCGGILPLWSGALIWWRWLQHSRKLSGTRLKSELISDMPKLNLSLYVSYYRGGAARSRPAPINLTCIKSNPKINTFDNLTSRWTIRRLSRWWSSVRR
jgi:hypothetical protein